MAFEEAMELLSGMFATLPQPVLSMVLESHSGNMERTVDYLIGLTPQEMDALQASARDLERLDQLDHQQDSAPSIAPPTVGEVDDDEDDAALDAELRRALELSQREQSGRPAGAEEADFTRALEATQHALGDVPRDEADQEQSDALLATMLQNQMLKQQLQHDRGFTAMLDGEGGAENEREGRRRGAAPGAAAPAPSSSSWGEMLGLWGAEEADGDARGEAAGTGRPQPADTTYQEGQGLFGAIAATGSWLGESLGLVEAEQPAAGSARAVVPRGDVMVAGGQAQPLARRRPPRPADKKDD